MRSIRIASATLAALLVFAISLRAQTIVFDSAFRISLSIGVRIPIRVSFSSFYGSLPAQTREIGGDGYGADSIGAGCFVKQYTIAGYFEFTIDTLNGLIHNLHYYAFNPYSYQSITDMTFKDFPYFLDHNGRLSARIPSITESDFRSISYEEEYYSNNRYYVGSLDSVLSGGAIYIRADQPPAAKVAICESTEENGILRVFFDRGSGIVSFRFTSSNATRYLKVFDMLGRSIEVRLITAGETRMTLGPLSQYRQVLFGRWE